MVRRKPDEQFGQDLGARAEPATQTVLTTVRELIVTGKVAPGMRLTAEAIAQDLGVSRTPVRSALAVLLAEGLVSYGVNRGYTVRNIALQDILDAIEARAVLESRACGLSVDYGWTDEELARLRGTVEAGAAIVEDGEWSEAVERDWYKLNRDFHSMIIRASRNATIRNAVRVSLIYPVFGDIARICPAAAARVPPRHRGVPATPPEHIRISQRDHEAILAAIAAEAAEVAEKAMLDHVLASKHRLATIATRR